LRRLSFTEAWYSN